MRYNEVECTRMNREMARMDRMQESEEVCREVGCGWRKKSERGREREREESGSRTRCVRVRYDVGGGSGPLF